MWNPQSGFWQWIEQWLFLREKGHTRSSSQMQTEAQKVICVCYDSPRMLGGTRSTWMLWRLFRDTRIGCSSDDSLSRSNLEAELSNDSVVVIVSIIVSPQRIRRRGRWCVCTGRVVHPNGKDNREKSHEHECQNFHRRELTHPYFVLASPPPVSGCHENPAQKGQVGKDHKCHKQGTNIPVKL